MNTDKTGQGSDKKIVINLYVLCDSVAILSKIWQRVIKNYGGRKLYHDIKNTRDSR